MKILVIYNKKSKPSAESLSQALKRQMPSHRVFRGNPAGNLVRTEKWDILINMGNSGTISRDFPTVNPPSKVAQCINKKKARMRFKAKGIPAPKLWLKVHEIPKREYPIIARKTFHMKGKGLWFCKTKKEALRAKKRGATHFLKYIDSTREFRVHVFSSAMLPKRASDYKVVKISEKMAEEKPKSEIVKNHENGYIFKSSKDPYNTLHSKISKVAKECLLNFGLHFGAVDIMWSTSTKKAMVLEINTTPCLTDDNANTSEIYAQNLQKLIEGIYKK